MVCACRTSVFWCRGVVETRYVSVDSVFGAGCGGGGTLDGVVGLVLDGRCDHRQGVPRSF